MPRELLTIDLRGLRPLLQARSRASGLAASVLVREALQAHLAESGGEPSRAGGAESPYRLATRRVRIHLRVTPTQAIELRQRARKAGFSVGGYVLNLMSTDPAPVSAGDWNDSRAALTASNAELATLSRNLAHLTALLRQGQVRAAMEYRQMLDEVHIQVRLHLSESSRVLAQLGRRRETPPAEES